MQDLVKNIEEDFSLDEIVKLQSLLGRIKQSKEDELRRAESLFKFSEDYLAMIKHTFSEKYLSSVQTTFNHLINFFGDECLLINIKPKDAEVFKQHLIESAPKGYPVYLRNLKAAFNKALLWEMISINPFEKIEIKKKQVRKPDFINKNELITILEQVDNPILKKLYLFAFYTGARLSECVLLKWRNINVKESLIIIGDDEFVTKSKKVREIPIGEAIKDFFVDGNKNQMIKIHTFFLNQMDSRSEKSMLVKYLKKQ